MGAPNYHFRVGQLNCVVLQDAADTGTAEQFFPNVPRADVEPLIAAHGLDAASIPFSYNCLVVNMPEFLLLMDGGQGTRMGKQGQLVNCLAAEHIQPEDIGYIFLSHGHLDHYGGLITDTGDFVFPNARYWMGKSEWNYWTSASRLPEIEAQNPARAEMLRRCLMPLQPRLTLIEHGATILPGVQALDAPGHTPHHMMLRLESDGESLFYIGDAALHPFHLEHLDWGPGNDASPEQAKQTRTSINQTAAETGALLLACHFPFPGVGRLAANNGASTWQPLA